MALLQHAALIAQRAGATLTAQGAGARSALTAHRAGAILSAQGASAHSALTAQRSGATLTAQGAGTRSAVSRLCCSTQLSQPREPVFLHDALATSRQGPHPSRA